MPTPLDPPWGTAGVLSCAGHTVLSIRHPNGLPTATPVRCRVRWGCPAARRGGGVPAARVSPRRTFELRPLFTVVTVYVLCIHTFRVTVRPCSQQSTRWRASTTALTCCCRRRTLRRLHKLPVLTLCHMPVPQESRRSTLHRLLGCHQVRTALVCGPRWMRLCLPLTARPCRRTQPQLDQCGRLDRPATAGLAGAH
jgi:hypothetical protein